MVTAFLIISLVIVVNQGSSVTAQDDNADELLAIESKNRAITILNNPQYVTQPKPSNNSLAQPNLTTHTHEQRPSSKPPNNPDKSAKLNQVEASRPHYGQLQLPTRLYSQPVKLHSSSNSIYKTYPRVVPLPPHHRYYYKNTRPSIHPNVVYAASTGKPAIIKSPKFSLPVQVINGIRSEFVRPPKNTNTTTSTSTSTTTEATTTTTQKVLRTKRIWPKRVLDKANTTLHNTTLTKDNTTKTLNNTTDEAERDTSESTHRTRYVYRNTTSETTIAPPSTTRSYRPVTRRVKVKSSSTSTLAPINFTRLQTNDWVPILPSHYANLKKLPPTPIVKRSDVFAASPVIPPSKQMMYLQSFGLVPIADPKNQTPVLDRKKMILLKSRRHLNPMFSGYSGKPRRAPTYIYGDLEGEGSHSRPPVVTKIKHHHHHHHHRYVKTVEKPVKVPYKVEVPKPYPVNVEKKVPVPVEKIKIVEKPVPYPVTVEKRVPYPIGIKIPHPVPVKVVEKEYVPKPYPVVQKVPVYQQVQVKVPQPVPVPYEKKVPYPVEIKVPVPVDRPVPVRVEVEKQVPYPVPVKVLVPQPYPVETKVPYPVEVKVREPVEVIRHVPIRVPYPQPYAIKTPYPIPVRVEKRVPYPIEVEKKVPVPVEVIVPQKVEVEKRVPFYVPRPYPVEKRIPYPVKIPYPVRVPVRIPVKVPVEVPVYIRHDGTDHYNDERYYGESSNIFRSVTDSPLESNTPKHTVTDTEISGDFGFLSRSDTETTTTTAPSS